MKQSSRLFLGTLILVFTLLMISPVGAITPEEFRSVVNVEVSLQELAILVRDQRFDEIDIDRFYILQGSVASTQVYNPDPEAFEAVIELVDSQWIELDRIERFRVYVLVTDPSFAARLPERLPRDPGPEIIRTNQELLVIGSFFNVVPDLTNPGDELYPIVEAIVIR